MVADAASGGDKKKARDVVAHQPRDIEHTCEDTSSSGTRSLIIDPP
jgi:hypothetical protein